NDIITLLTGNPTKERTHVRLPLKVLENMHASGLIKLGDQNIYVREEGRKFGETLKLTLRKER
ncbi:MAG: hypothetical protein ACTSP1_19110, partial [Candidatus Freyarchaeota archaeon]